MKQYLPLNGLLCSLGLAFDVAGRSFADIPLERIVRIRRVSLLHKNTREMRTSGHTPAARFHFFECDFDSPLLQSLYQAAVAGTSILLLSGEPGAELL